MIRIEKSVVINAPAEKVFAYIMDPANTPEYMTGAHEVTDVRRLPNGGYHYKVPARVAGIRLEVTNDDIEVVPNERVVSKMESSFMDGVLTGRLEPLPDDKTRMSFVSEITLHGGPLGRLGEAFFTNYFDHSIELEIASIKARIESEELAATPS